MKTILVVDDDKQAREMFSHALTQSGYRVLEAGSAPTCLAMAQQHLPDLILSDINMPGGTGSTLLRDIRLDPELRSKKSPFPCPENKSSFNASAWRSWISD